MFIQLVSIVTYSVKERAQYDNVLSWRTGILTNGHLKLNGLISRIDHCSGVECSV